MTFDEFRRVYNRATKNIKKGCDPVGNATAVWHAARYLKNATRREINLAAAYAIQAESLVNTGIHPEDKAAARRCIGSNGKYNMPVRDWRYEA